MRLQTIVVVMVVVLTMVLVLLTLLMKTIAEFTTTATKVLMLHDVSGCPVGVATVA